MRKVAAAALTDVTAGWDRAQVGEQVLVGGKSYLTTSLTNMAGPSIVFNT